MAKIIGMWCMVGKENWNVLHGKGDGNVIHGESYWNVVHGNAR